MSVNRQAERQTDGMFSPEETPPKNINQSRKIAPKREGLSKVTQSRNGGFFQQHWDCQTSCILFLLPAVYFSLMHLNFSSCLVIGQALYLDAPSVACSIAGIEVSVIAELPKLNLGSRPIVIS